VVDAVVALTARGADVNARETWRGQTALMWAAAEGNTAAVRALARAGADVKAQSKAGFTPLLFAAREGRLETAGALLDLGSSLDETLSINSNESAGGVELGEREANLDAFLLASGNAHFELAAYFVKRGANPNAAPRGWTALHQVSWVRKTGEAGSSNPPPQGSGGMTSLEFVKFLAERGADVNAKATVRSLPAGSSRLNYIGATPFFMAARTADVELMRLLLELGAEPLVPTKAGTTPLMVAAGVGSSLPGEEAGTDAEAVEAVKMLLALGGDVNAVDTGGDTAMHGAAYKHLPGVAQLLGDSGAKVEIWNRKNKAGFTPIDIAAGIQRGMNFVFSFETEAVLRGLLTRAGVAANQR
jgi:ankyrin repeat protein